MEKPWYRGRFKNFLKNTARFSGPARLPAVGLAQNETLESQDFRPIDKPRAPGKLWQELPQKQELRQELQPMLREKPEGGATKMPAKLPKLPIKPPSPSAAKPTEFARQEFERLLQEGLSARSASRAVGISPSTGIAWAKTTKENSDTFQDKGPIGSDEQRVTDLLLSKAEYLLMTLGTGSEERYKNSKAIEALLGKYLAFTGQTQESHVTVTNSSEELDKLLKQLTAPVETAAAQEADATASLKTTKWSEADANTGVRVE